MKKYRKIILLVFVLLIVITSFFLGKSFGKEEVYLDERPKQIKHENTLSMMLETEAGSGNYEMTTRSEWPTEGYVFNSELSKCENGGELSWDDTNKRVVMSGNVSDKCYVYFDVYVPPTLADFCNNRDTLAACVKKFGDQGADISNIYIHNSSLTNGAGDNSYRYAGASENVNNFVCFGTNTTPCPTDNLYRIIGVFGDEVKLIKYDYGTSTFLGTDGDYYGQYPFDSGDYKGSNYANITAYYWNLLNTITLTDGYGSNTWSTSLLNTTNLNTNFITNIGEVWAKKIAETTWKVGGNTKANIGNVVPATMYQNEVVNPVTTNTTDGATEYTAKIGLMYASDYGYAADPSAWALTMHEYNNTTATSTNWMYMGLNEWTISRYASDTSRVLAVIGGGVFTSGGSVDVIPVNDNYAVRPTFYLISSITYKSGSGTQSDPITIN